LNALIPQVLQISNREQTTVGDDHSRLPRINATPGPGHALCHSVKGTHSFPSHGGGTVGQMILELSCPCFDGLGRLTVPLALTLEEWCEWEYGLMR
jgi:hypothetical protein